MVRLVLLASAVAGAALPAASPSRPRPGGLATAGVVKAGLLLMPLLTMWHEIGWHAAVCVLQGGHAATIGAFYVDCVGLRGAGNVLVAGAGVSVNAVLAIAAYISWRNVTGDTLRITLWLIWVSEAFVASGYFLFSGVTGYGDLGIGEGGSLSGFGLTWPIQVVEVIAGAASYATLLWAAIRALNVMIGNGPGTRLARRSIAHGYYVSAGAAAVLVGLLNPLGIVITIMSAAASSFGGLAGFISIGFATGREGEPRPILIRRNVAVICAGVTVVMAFALLLGPSLHFKA